MQIKISNSSAGGNDTNLEIPCPAVFKCSAPVSEEIGRSSYEDDYTDDNAIPIRLCWS